MGAPGGIGGGGAPICIAIGGGGGGGAGTFGRTGGGGGAAEYSEIPFGAKCGLSGGNGAAIIFESRKSGNFNTIEDIRVLPEYMVVVVVVVEVEVPSSGVHLHQGEGEGEAGHPYPLPWEEVGAEELPGPSGKWVDQEGEGDHRWEDALHKYATL